MLMEETGHRALVPVIERPGLVTHEEDHVFAQAIDVVHVGHQVAPTIATSVEQQRVGRLDVVVVRRQFVRTADDGQRQEFEREIKKLKTQFNGCLAVLKTRLNTRSLPDE